jgi:hypothetical protein
MTQLAIAVRWCPHLLRDAKGTAALAAALLKLDSDSHTSIELDGIDAGGVGVGAAGTVDGAPGAPGPRTRSEVSTAMDEDRNIWVGSILRLGERGRFDRHLPPPPSRLTSRPISHLAPLCVREGCCATRSLTPHID